MIMIKPPKLNGKSKVSHHRNESGNKKAEEATRNVGCFKIE
jgi:hypothetical protein